LPTTKGLRRCSYALSEMAAACAGRWVIT
jgi:hypothetical protein